LFYVAFCVLFLVDLSTFWESTYFRTIHLQLTNRACRRTGISIPSARYRWWL